MRPLSGEGTPRIGVLLGGYSRRGGCKACGELLKQGLVLKLYGGNAGFYGLQGLQKVGHQGNLIGRVTGIGASAVRCRGGLTGDSS